jgi:mannan endo-1,4-beta-mannosidase
VDSTVNFAWRGGSPDSSITNDNFSTEWTGTIYIPEDADYTFSLYHDDVMILNIDGTEIYNSRTWTGGENNY